MFSANSSQVSEDRLYVEDVFSTWLYTGNGSTQTITNGIDLAGKGGLVWCKQRAPNAGFSHALFDTSRGVNRFLISDGTNAELTASSNTLTAFNSNGFSLGADTTYGLVNQNNCTFASWTFREAPKFFDVVTYTGDGVSGREIAHNLGVAPGCIIIKRTDTSVDWIVWHRGNGTTNYNLMALNLTDASTGSLSSGDLPTATTFKPGALLGPAYNSGNNTGGTYVAYLFAHDTTSDGIIQCGSYTTTGNNDINLGWEPQWILEKRANGLSSWHIWDNMRGMSQTNLQELNADLAGAETSFSSGYVKPTATGYNNTYWGSGQTVIYIAIRRGPMRTPTSGTSVFSPNVSSAAAGTVVSTGFPIDLQIALDRDGTFGTGDIFVDRLRGISTTNVSTSTPRLFSAMTSAESSGLVSRDWGNTGYDIPNDYAGVNLGYLNFRRAPSFFDEVCYTGTGSTTIPHNLGVAPEMMIVKSRSAINDWYVYSASIGATKALRLNVNGTPLTTSAWWNNTAPTSTVFTVGSDAGVSGSGTTFVAYLFASCPGVSKVGSYTGNGSSQTINCGFAAGARFVMIKRTDSTGDWYVWDSARGIVSGNDPRLSLNSTAAEVTTDDSVDTDSSGFVVNQLSATNINVSSATYIYLAVA